MNQNSSLENIWKEEMLSQSSIDTETFGHHVASNLSEQTIIAFFGELGTGKTILIKGIISSLSSFETWEINSPTFTYLNIYPAPIPIYHFDLYRLRSAEEFISMGFDEYFEKRGICLIEWAERIEPLLHPSIIRIALTHHDENQRLIKITQGGIK